MAEDNVGGVILEPSQGNKAAPLGLHITSRSAKCLRIAVQRRVRILNENPVTPPVAKKGSGTSVWIVVWPVRGSPLAQNDPDQVVRAGRVVTFLHFRVNLVVGLGRNVGERNSGGIISKRAKGFYVGHSGGT